MRSIEAEITLAVEVAVTEAIFTIQGSSLEISVALSTVNSLVLELVVVVVVA